MAKYIQQVLKVVNPNKPRKEESHVATVDQMDRRLPPRSKWKFRAFAALATVLAILVGVWAVFASRDAIYRVPINRVSIATVSSGQFEDFIAVRASVAPFETHYIATADGGTIHKVLVEDGADVQAGQPVVTLSNSTLQSQIARQQADAAAQINALLTARIQLQESKYTFARTLLEIDHEIDQLRGRLERDKVLLDGNAISPATYKEEVENYAHAMSLRKTTIEARDEEERNRNTQTKQIEETLARLNNNMRFAQASLDALTVVAPLSGQLTGLDAIVGQSKAPGAILGQIDTRDRFKLVANIDEFYLGRVMIDQTASLTVGQQEVSAKVVKIYPQVSSGTFRVDLFFEGVLPQGFRSGQTVDLRIQLGGSAKAIVLPNGPFYQETGGGWVFLVTPDGESAIRHEVRFGRRNSQYLEIESGLSSGQRVIVSSYQAFEKVDRIMLLSE